MAGDDPETTQSPGATSIDVVRAMSQFTPQGRALGIEVTKLEAGKIWGRVPYRADLVGDPESGVIAVGVITTFLDQLSGMAAVLVMPTPTTVATIDIRIDYMRGAKPGRDVHAEAHCYKLGRNVAFVRAVAYEDSPDNPIAHAASAFMVGANQRFGANLREKKT